MYKSDKQVNSAAIRRLKGVLSQVSPSVCAGNAPGTTSHVGAETPPVVNVDREGLPPQPWLKEQSDRLGGLFTVRTPSGKERVVLTDPSLFQSLFYPDEVHLSRLFGMRQFNERGFKWRGGGVRQFYVASPGPSRGTLTFQVIASCRSPTPMC